jgi:hypothetical protein
MENKDKEAIAEVTFCALKPIFDSLKSCHPDYQGLVTTPKGLGTTFPVFPILDSCDFS